MPEVRFSPLSQADTAIIEALLKEEEQAWMAELDWDYAPIRGILVRFVEQQLLPGFVAISESEARGYTYFLVAHAKGMIGAVYTCGPDPQAIADELLTRAIENLKRTRSVRRIEAQIIPLNGLDLKPVFLSHGFDYFQRHYLELDLASFAADNSGTQDVARWMPHHAIDCAEVAYRSYRNSIDLVISEDYGSVTNCEQYIRSLVENPGCGIFLEDCSFVVLDSRAVPCGFILCSQLSRTSAMIPQISIHPAHQGRRLGSTLICRALQELRKKGFRTVRLTVSHQNRRAYAWYQRLGFVKRRDFGAYVWLRK